MELWMAAVCHEMDLLEVYFFADDACDSLIHTDDTKSEFDRFSVLSQLLKESDVINKIPNLKRINMFCE